MKEDSISIIPGASLWTFILTILSATIIGSVTTYVSIRMMGAVQTEQIETLKRDTNILRVQMREMERDLGEHKLLQIHPGAGLRLNDVERRIEKIENRR